MNDLRGGQGRSDKEIQESGEIFYASCVLAGFLLAAALAIGLWAGMNT